MGVIDRSKMVIAMEDTSHVQCLDYWGYIILPLVAAYRTTATLSIDLMVLKTCSIVTD